MDQENLSLDEALEMIDKDLLKQVQNYVETGEWKNKDNSIYMKCYTACYRLADHNDNAERMYEYHKNTLSKYLE